MRFRFDNGLVLGGEEFHIQAPIEGLETPEIRNGDGVFSGADGGYLVSQYYGQRTITIRGFFIGNCPDETTRLRQKLLRNLFMRYYSGIVIEDFAEQYWFTQGYISDVKCEVTSAKMGEYQISILCPDPAIYKASNWYSETPEKITTSLVVNGDTSILRQGDMEAFPVYKFTGQFTAPFGIQIENGVFILDYSSSGVVTVDMQTRQVYDENNVSLAQYREIDSYWLGLHNGVNKIQILTADSADTGTVEMTYSAGFRGI